MHRLASTLFFIAVSTPLCARSDSLNLAALLKNGGIRVEDSNGEVLLAHRDKESFIPASTMKIATSFCALEELGRDYLFTTEILAGPGNTLYIKGSGDPSLVSEELALMAKAIAAKISTVNRLVIDTSLFAPGIEIDGASRSTNPYDAKNGAFVGNFGTAFLTRRRDGSVSSAEPQTPLTPLARAAATRVKKGTTERINLGHDWRAGALYGGELLVELLKRESVSGAGKIEIGPIPADARLLLRYASSKRLEDIVRGLLEYSTNFTANQVFLVAGMERLGPPATVEKGQRVLKRCLESRAGWADFHAEEGSGLSRRTRVSPDHMTKLLKVFEKYRDLLPDEEGFRAKTGSLTGVNALAGYFPLPRSGMARFAILINSNVPHAYKVTVARAVRKHLSHIGH